MANGYKYGETNPSESAAKSSATVIEVGDMIYQDEAASNVPKPMADRTWNTNLATTQEEVHDLFLGIALERGRSGDTGAIRFATEGVFEFDCASATFKIGDLVGPAKQSGNALESQKVVAVATENLAIGRVAKLGASVTKVLVSVKSTKLLGGPQAMA